MNDDSQDLRIARSRWNARKTDSSLIAWVCSPEWTQPMPIPPWATEADRGSVIRLRKIPSDRPKGFTWYATHDHVVECSGEIDVV